MLICVTLVLSGTVGNTFGIRNSFVYNQQTEPPSIIKYKSPWNDSLPPEDSSNNTTWRPLCQPGICNNMTQHINEDPQNDGVSLSQTYKSKKDFNLNHSFVSNSVLGPDRFRFITSYWTTSDTSRVIDAGTSANETRFSLWGPDSATTWPNLMANPKVEVDAGEGFSTLAVVLQYEGVVNLAGITAALKLPLGFKAQLPLTEDMNNYNIVLSSYRGHIYPSQGIVLYFSLDVTTKAKVQSPGLGILALHFLRTDQRSILDSLDAYQQNLFAHALSNTNTNTTSHNPTMFNNDFDFSRDYFNQFGRFIPFDFINQITPIVFKVTGKEILDVSLAGGDSSQATIQAKLSQNQSNAINGIVPLTNTFQPIGRSPNVTNTNVVTGTGNSTSNATATTSLPNNSSLDSDSVTTSISKGGDTAVSKGSARAPVARLISFPVYVFFSNRGDVRIHDLVATFSTNVSSLIGAAVSETTYPLGIVGQSTFHLFTLEPYSSQAVTLFIRSSVSCSALAPLSVRSSYTNVVGLTQTQTNTITLGVGSGICPQKTIPGGGTGLG
ncbi:MAG: hypothetical protein WA667_13215 [Candidatus Nitrosopolaris sp.]